MNAKTKKTRSGAKDSKAKPSPVPSLHDTPSRERVLFDALSPDNDDRIPASAVSAALQRVGIRADDPRVIDSLERLSRGAQTPRPAPRNLSFSEFARVIKPNVLMLERALKNNLVIPDFEAFEHDIDAIFNEAETNRSGAVASYIPQLGRVDPEQFGLALCTIDGQRLERGDSGVPFCVQSSVKPVLYSLALEEHGDKTVHRHIGCEPSGQSFNELTLSKDGLPHNPMINAGAIMSSALILPQATMADRFDHLLDMWRDLSGGVKPGFSNPVYLSERRTADRNFALGHFMREQGAFPVGTDLIETLEFYFQACSLEVTAESMSVLAATLANGGICPVTGERVFGPKTVQKCLSLMYSCGMYDYSGAWAFHVGLPAKSGVSGVIMVVIPNVLGLCVWSPRLDAQGNSVRGIEFCRGLVRTFNFHNYDNLVGGLSDKKDPRINHDQVKRNLLVDLCWAASEGDLDGVRRLEVQGAHLDAADYDGRTALHLAASEGQHHVVEYFVRRGVRLDPVDRWGNTPLDDARQAGHGAVAALLDTDVAA